MNRKRSLILFGIGLTLLVSVGIANAQGPKGTGQPRAPRDLAGTAFTYQGQLKNGGSAVNSTCDFEFSLWDGPNVGASQIGGNQPKTNVAVSTGLFTIPDLDFGSGAFNGDARYLLIGVRCPAGSGSFTMLSPRQPLTPAPYALALPGLYTQQNNDSPNLIGGYSGNSVTSGVKGATIGSGGESGKTNRVTDDYGIVGGGYNNQAGDNDGATGDNTHATVGGGYYNTASGFDSTVGGGGSNTASGSASTISGGSSNTASITYATVGGGGGNTASDLNATIGGGYRNTASGNAATIGGGYYNTASGNYATVPGGNNANASHYGETADASGRFAATGDAQTSLYVVRNTTASLTQTELFLDGDGAAQRITIASERTVTFDILVVAHTNGGSSAGYRIIGVIENQGGTTSFIGTPTVTALGADPAAAWTVAAAADNTNDALEVKVTGSLLTTIRWVASVRTVEVSY